MRELCAVSLMFAQDHRRDFDTVLETEEPFALVRFGDGEDALIDGAPHRSADAWSTEGPTWLQRELMRSLFAKLPGFCVGLPTPCCLSRGVRLRNSSPIPRSQQTFATLFMHANLPRAYELQQRFSDAVIVNADYGEIKIPADGVSKPWDVDAVVAQLQKVEGRPILMAAGPCANVLAHRYWRRQPPEKRVSIIDVGSMLDVLHGNVNRHYHGKMNDHRCRWAASAQPAPRSSGAASPQRLRIGRIEPKGEVTPIQRSPKRIRVGGKR